MHQILKSEVSIKGCVLDRFSTGNFDSLKVDGIREHLLKYYNEHYSANIMNLCLAGNYSLDELQKMAIEYFSGIEDK